MGAAGGAGAPADGPAAATEDAADAEGEGAAEDAIAGVGVAAGDTRAAAGLVDAT
jgi:hypothetical protein